MSTTQGAAAPAADVAFAELPADFPLPDYLRCIRAIEVAELRHRLAHAEGDAAWANGTFTDDHQTAVDEARLAFVEAKLAYRQIMGADPIKVAGVWA